MNYDLTDWLWLFLIYCFLGWIWETAFVSFKMKKLVKRGFLYGPWLPIYGFGALIILYITGPYRDRWYLIYCLGAIAATVLEALTGALMESLFHMRYWDYSREPYNYKGYICLKVSLFWGVFALLLDEVLQKQVDKILMAVSGQEMVLWPLLLLFAIDVIASIRNAVNIKDFMALSESAEQILSTAEIKVKNFADDLRLRSSLGENIFDTVDPQKANKKKAALLESLGRYDEHRIRRLKEFIGYTDELMTEIKKQIKDSALSERRNKLDAIYRSVSDFRISLSETLNSFEMNRSKQIKKIYHLLNTYPNLTSKRYQDILTKIKKITGR